MNKKEIQGEVDRRLSNGESKTLVFRLLSGSGINDRVLAHQIASYASPMLCQCHSKLILAMIVIAWVQLVIALLIGIVIGLKMGLLGMLIVTAFVGALAYLFVWGFSHNKAWAYNATILLSIANSPKSLNGFTETPILSIVSLLLGIALFSFTWFVRRKLFPDFAFIAPKKVKGAYVFSN